MMELKVAMMVSMIEAMRFEMDSTSEGMFAVCFFHLA